MAGLWLTNVLFDRPRRRPLTKMTDEEAAAEAARLAHVVGGYQAEPCGCSIGTLMVDDDTASHGRRVIVCSLCGGRGYWWKKPGERAAPGYSDRKLVALLQREAATELFAILHDTAVALIAHANAMLERGGLAPEVCAGLIRGCEDMAVVLAATEPEMVDLFAERAPDSFEALRTLVRLQ